MFHTHRVLSLSLFLSPSLSLNISSGEDLKVNKIYIIKIKKTICIYSLKWNMLERSTGTTEGRWTCPELGKVMALSEAS